VSAGALESLRATTVGVPAAACLSALLNGGGTEAADVVGPGVFEVTAGSEEEAVELCSAAALLLAEFAGAAFGFEHPKESSIAPAASAAAALLICWVPMLRINAIAVPPASVGFSLP